MKFNYIITQLNILYIVHPNWRVILQLHWHSSDVIQGSIIGPLLFILYIKDSQLYADDVKLYCSIVDSDDLDVMQDRLHLVQNW